MIRRFIILCALVPLLFSCRKENPQLTVYSDTAETAILVDLFNQTQKNYHARFIYAGTEKGELQGPGSHEVIIGRDIHSSAYKTRMKNLDGYRTSSFVSSVYPSILKTGVEDRELRTIPLSLELPAVLSSPGTGDDGKFIDWDEMTDLSSEFNELEDEALIHCGFSPLWSDSFLKTWFNAKVNLNTGMESDADFLPVIESADALIDWINEVNGGLDADEAYSAKYRYIPDYRLVMEGRSAFTVLPLSAWALLPDTITRGLSMQLLNPGKGLIALDILSIGLPENSRNPEGADAFLEWLLRESTWVDYLKLNSRYRDESFTFLGGISASEKLNIRLLPEYFPSAAVIAPRKGEFAAQPEIPSQWSKVWTSLFLPLVKDRLEGTARSFPEEYRKWLLQNPDPWDTLEE